MKVLDFLIDFMFKLRHFHDENRDVDLIIFRVTFTTFLCSI